MNAVQKKSSPRITGIFYIAATVAGILSVAIADPILRGNDFLHSISANTGKVVLSALLELLMAAAILGIPVMLFATLKQHNEKYAIGYIAARILEVIPIIGGVISLLCLQIVSQIYLNAGSLEGSFFKTLSILLRLSHDFTDVVGTQIIFSLTALILNYSLYKINAVPRFISVWGLIGAPLILISGLLIVFGVVDSFSPVSVILFAPIALQEMAFAIWLIIKGFDSTRNDLGKVS